MASSVNRTALETIVTATMLTRLLVAIANVDAAWDVRTTAREEPRFALEGVRFATIDFTEMKRMKRWWVRRFLAA
jgi:hypothetical protein